MDDDTRITLNTTQSAVWHFLLSIECNYLPSIAETSVALGLGYAAAQRAMLDLMNFGLLIRERSSYSTAYIYHVANRDAPITTVQRVFVNQDCAPVCTYWLARKYGY
jgi:hypothetical protein